jgi:hypothetical protein
MHTIPKSAYTKPELVEVGSFEDVTLGGSTGSSLDAAFPSGTPFSDLTFS